MDAVTPTPPDPWRPKKPSLAERHGGVLISVAFHIAFFAILNNYAIRSSPAPPPEPQPIVIDLFQEEPQQAGAAAEEPEAELETVAVGDEAVPPEEPPPTFEEVVATVAEDALDEEGLQAVAPEEAPFSPPEPTEPLEPEPAPEEPVEPEAEEPEPEEPAPEESESIGSDSEPPPPEPDEKRERELRKLAELERSREEASADPTLEQQESGSTQIAERLQAAAIQLQAQKWLSTTAGLDRGVIRSFENSDYPERVTEEVLARYGMKTGYKYVSGKGGGHSFLNQVRTSKGTYTNQIAEGMHYVFSYTERSIAHMVRMETEAMRRRGFDPSTYRKVEVVFGIVPTTGGYDLGVIRLEVAPVDLNPDP